MIETKRRPPEPLTKDEVLALIEATGNGISDVRDRALIMMLWRTGLRVSEAISLQDRDIDRTESGMIVRVRHGKGDKSRTVAISASVASRIEEWLRIRRSLVGSTVFCRVRRKGGKNAPLTAGAVRKMLKNLGQQAGIEKRVHPHGLRRTFALELDSEGVPLRVIQQALGHADASTTSTYLSALGGREVVGMLQARMV
jgi:integrase/recombinase XerD